MISPAGLSCGMGLLLSIIATANAPTVKIDILIVIITGCVCTHISAFFQAHVVSKAKQATRRQALTLVAAGAATLTPIAGRAQACSDERVADSPDAQTWAHEREKVISLGFTEDEATCWELITRSAAKFFELPELHPSDAPEVAEAIHYRAEQVMTATRMTTDGR